MRIAGGIDWGYFDLETMDKNPQASGVPHIIEWVSQKKNDLCYMTTILFTVSLMDHLSFIIHDLDVM